MSDQSSNLGLSFLQPAQAQKHVTVNESLLRLEALIQLGVTSATTAVQPSSPIDGSVYILPAGKTGSAWGAMTDGALAYWPDGAWEQITPKEGWIGFIRDTDLFVHFTGAAWSPMTGPLGAARLDAAQIFRARQTITNDASAPETPVRDAVLHLNRNTGGTLRITFDALAGANAFSFRRTNGSRGARSSLYAGETNGSLQGRGWSSDTCAHELQANIDFVASENWSASGRGMLINFFATEAENTARTAVCTMTPAAVYPATDNAAALGAAANRWSTVYAATGVINTSDAREKTPLQPIPANVKRAVRRVIAQVGVFQWLEAVERKGSDRARLHVGVTAQTVRDAFIAEGEDPGRWGLYCEDTIGIEPGVCSEGGTRLGVGLDQ
jgi:hypothetical protein